MKSTMGCFGFLAFLVFATLGLWFLEGYTITKFWGWFITPTFEIKTPPLWTCVGLAMLIGFLTNHNWASNLKEQMEKDEDSEEAMKRAVFVMVASVVRMLAILFCGWIVYCL